MFATILFILCALNSLYTIAMHYDALRATQYGNDAQDPVRLSANAWAWMTLMFLALGFIGSNSHGVMSALNPALMAAHLYISYVLNVHVRRYAREFKSTIN